MRHRGIDFTATLLTVFGIAFAGIGVVFLGSLLLPSVRDSLASDVRGPYAQPVGHPLLTAIGIGIAFVAVGAFVLLFAARWRLVDIRLDDEGMHVQNVFQAFDIHWSEIASLETDRLGSSTPHLARLRNGRTVRLAALGRGRESEQLLRELRAELERRQGTG